jgi:hypothetical protein
MGGWNRLFLVRQGGVYNKSLSRIQVMMSTCRELFLYPESRLEGRADNRETWRLFFGNGTRTETVDSLARRGPG